MKVPQTFSVELNIKEKLPELRKKVDLNLEIENLFLRLMKKNNINIKQKEK